MERESVSTCGLLVPGDVVTAYTSGLLAFTGCVTEVQSDAELFWAVDSTGQRQLIDLGSYSVYRVAPPYL